MKDEAIEDDRKEDDPEEEPDADAGEFDANAGSERATFGRALRASMGLLRLFKSRRACVIARVALSVPCSAFSVSCRALWITSRS